MKQLRMLSCSACWVLMLLVLGATVATAHDIPPSVTLQIFLHPQGEELQVLVRVPLEAMQDMRFPTTGPGYLDLEAVRANGVLEDAAMLWVGENIELYEDGRPLPELDVRAVRISLPGDRAFSGYEQARAHLSGPALPTTTRIAWRQAMFDIWLVSPIEGDSPTARFSIRPRHARLGLTVSTVLRFVSPEGAVRAFEYRGDPGLIELDPTLTAAASRFVEAGFFHILDGLDHLLFLLCLVIPLRRMRQLVAVVTSFTVAHSITLIGSAYGLAPDALWFPALVELLIAVSIVYMAFENILGAQLERRWWIAFGFGLVHGFGFSFALKETLQFAGSHLLTSLLSFNVGVELGQVFVLMVSLPILNLVFRRVVSERPLSILLSALVAHTSWHWMSERAATLARYRLAPSSRFLGLDRWLDWLFEALPRGLLPSMTVVAILVYLGVAAWRGRIGWRARYTQRTKEAERDAPTIPTGSESLDDVDGTGRSRLFDPDRPGPRPARDRRVAGS